VRPAGLARQIRFRPPQPLQLLRQNSLRSDFPTLSTQLSSVMVAQLTGHPFQDLPPKFLAPQTPAPPQGCQCLLVLLSPPAPFHPLLELLSPRRAVCPDAVFAQQPIHAHPRRPMLRGGGIPYQAAPGVGHQPFFGLDHSRPHRIQMHVVAHGLQIAVATTVHHQRLVASAKHVPEELMPRIQADRVSAQQPGHAGNKVGLGGFHHQVKVIGHEAIGMNLKTGLLARLGQGLEEILAIHIVQENVVPAVTPAHDMVNGARVLNSELARHGLTITEIQRTVKNQNALIYGLTPLYYNMPQRCVWPVGLYTGAWSRQAWGAISHRLSAESRYACP
jgi:hypothetical protein